MRLQAHAAPHLASKSTTQIMRIRQKGRIIKRTYLSQGFHFWQRHEAQYTQTKEVGKEGKKETRGLLAFSCDDDLPGTLDFLNQFYRKTSINTIYLARVGWPE